ncbi:MAG: polysaccharide biosynthesis tyrosine autokinase [Terrimicrobiaceae bacterium]
MSEPHPTPHLRLPAQLADLDFDFWRYFNLVVRHLWLVGLITGLALILAFAWLLRQPDIYASKAVLQIEQQEQKVIKMDDIQAEKMDSLDYLKTMQEAMENRSLLLRVVKAAGLEKDPVFAPPRPNDPYTDSELAELMAKKVDVKLRRGTRLIELAVEDRNPEQARNLAELVIKEFLRQNFDQRFELSRVANEFLQEEAARLKLRLEQSEQKLQRYKEKENAVSLEQTQNITIERLKDLNSKVTEAKGMRLRIEADLGQLKTLAPDDYDSILEIGSVAAIPDVAVIREKIVKAESDFAAAQKRYLEKHPKYLQAKGQLEQLRQSLGTTLKNAGDILRKQYEGSGDTETKLETALAEQEKAALKLNKIAIPYNVLLREVESDRTTYENVINRLHETQITQAVEKSPFRILEEPMVSNKPVKPARKKILLAALALGALLSCGVVFLIDALDPSLRSVDSAEAFLSLPCLAVVPQITRLKGETREQFQARSDRPLIIEKEGNSTQAEAFRTLRASLSLLPDNARRRVFLFTSAIPSEGKTFSAINAGAAFALEGLKTIVIDADLRLPAVQKALLHTGEELPGLTDALAGNTALSEVIHGTHLKNLSALPAGRRAPNPAELLGAGGFASLLEELSKSFDRIVIDSAPINAVSDTLRIAANADYTCLVVQSSRTPKRAVIRAIKMLAKAQARLGGFVLNRTSLGHTGQYYYYHYGDKYHKESVYGSPEAKA